MIDDRYILIDGVPTAEPDLMKWSRWLEDNDRRIERTEITKDIYVSTVFLGVDHGFGCGPPVLFETMILGGPLDLEMERHETLGEAKTGHFDMVDRARAKLNIHPAT